MEPRVINSFQVRIYRFNKHRPQTLLGTIESATTDKCLAFCSVEQLWSILTTQLSEPLADESINPGPGHSDAPTSDP